MNEPVSVREVMNREYVGASESDDLLNTTELLVRENEPTALVLRGNDPIGVVNRADILAYFVSEGESASATVGEVMRESIPSISPDARLTEARDSMMARSTEWMLVVKEGDPLGTVTEHDILATARFESEVTEQVAEQTEVATTNQGAPTDTTERTDDSFSEQGICSACGTLTRSLASHNGQLLCADCRDV